MIQTPRKMVDTTPAPPRQANPNSAYVRCHRILPTLAIRTNAGTHAYSVARKNQFRCRRGALSKSEPPRRGPHRTAPKIYRRQCVRPKNAMVGVVVSRRVEGRWWAWTRTHEPERSAQVDVPRGRPSIPSPRRLRHAAVKARPQPPQAAMLGKSAEEEAPRL